ncbi:MAG: UDP-2,3-diacylglucosamine hydrolase [Bacteroidetes bacterium]|nr:UDP-2,3-diacylglucosamine hydrolase [Bacteroidota bacterium]
MSQKKNTYFLSDFHLGVPNAEESLKREIRLVNWLDSVKDTAESIYLMGDLFDFWFEYKQVIPKGYVRFLGKLAELVDQGIEVHLFRGNHDIWAFDYLEKEIGIILHRKPEVKEIQGKTFYLAHGDGLGPGDHSYKFLKKVFEFKLNQFLFKWLHPDIGVALGLWWSKKSRLSKYSKAHKKEAPPIEQEMLVRYASEHAKENSEIEYYVFGHAHMAINYEINENQSLIILGDWISKFTFAVFDGNEIKLEAY